MPSCSPPGEAARSPLQGSGGTFRDGALDDSHRLEGLTSRFLLRGLLRQGLADPNLLTGDHGHAHEAAIVRRAIDVEGPPHDRRFVCVAMIAGEQVGIGKASTKKAAEQDAARQALEAMGSVAAEPS